MITKSSLQLTRTISMLHYEKFWLKGWVTWTCHHGKIWLRAGMKNGVMEMTHKCTKLLKGDETQWAFGNFFFLFFIISIDTQVWNVLSVCHEWKSTSSSEDTTSMLRILFLSAMTGSTGCITENWVLHTLTHKKKQYVTSCYHYWPELWSTWMVDMESVQRKWSIIWIKQFKWQL